MVEMGLCGGDGLLQGGYLRWQKGVYFWLKHLAELGLSEIKSRRISEESSPVEIRLRGTSEESRTTEIRPRGTSRERKPRKKNELGIDALRACMVFYIKSHGNLCAGFLLAVSWSFGWFSRFSLRNSSKRWWCVF